MADKLYTLECNSDTYLGCIEKSVFASNKPWPLEIRTGDYCLLHHYEIGGLLGLWRATTAGGRHLVPKLWAGRFPFQVKVQLVSEKIAEVPKTILTAHGMDAKVGRFDGAMAQATADEIVRAMTK